MEFRNLHEIQTAIQARHISVPLSDAAAVHPDQDAHDCALRLRSQGFDYAPVIDDGHVVGLFSRSHDAGPGQSVQQYARGLAEDLLVSETTPVARLFAFMSQEPFLFVVSERRISGFVTTTDLGSSPVRTHFYLLLAAAEMAMATIVRRDYPDQQVAVQLLPEGRREKHAELIKELRRDDNLLDDVAALYFVDLLRICGHSATLRTWMKENGRSFRKSTDGLGAFRNHVMHPVRDFTDGSAKRVARLAERDRDLAHLIQALAHVLGPTDWTPFAARQAATDSARPEG